MLVLGRDNQTFLAVVRSLGRRGLEVHVAWCPDDSATLRSRYVAEVHRIHRYAPGGPWLEEMIALLDRERFELVIPASEQAVHPLQLHRAELEPHARIYLLDDEAARIGFDKAETYALAKRLAIRVPRQLSISSRAEIDRLLNALTFPIVLKPSSSYDPHALGQRRDVAKAYDERELEAHLARMLEGGGTVLVQENFLGKGVGVEVLADRGEVLFAFQHERVHEPPRGGGSSYRKSVPLSPELLDDAKRLMRALEYTGVAMIEFKVAPGDHVFLEINARFWGSLPLAVAAGADFPYWLYQLLVEGRRDFPAEYKTGLYARNLIGDLKWMGQNLAADRGDPTLAVRSLPAVALELRHALMLRERSDTFVLDDPLPGFAEVAHYVRLYASHTRDVLRARWMERSPLRKEKSAAARRALESARSVLFVCKGNICRSPFAHHVAAKLAPSRTVASAGFYPEDGRRSPAEAVRAARERGIDLEAHRSRVIDARMVREADAIFIFDEENYRAVEEAFSWAVWKTHRFGHLARSGAIDVEDPYGSDLSGFRACYARIEGLLSEVLA